MAKNTGSIGKHYSHCTHLLQHFCQKRISFLSGFPVYSTQASTLWTLYTSTTGVLEPCTKWIWYNWLMYMLELKIFSSRYDTSLMCFTRLLVLQLQNTHCLHNLLHLCWTGLLVLSGVDFWLLRSIWGLSLKTWSMANRNWCFFLEVQPWGGFQILGGP